MEQPTQRKPVLTLRKKPDTPPALNPATTPNLQDQLPQEYTDFNVEHFSEWDIPEIADVEPKRRKRRKDKHVEQYRKEARWQ